MRRRAARDVATAPQVEVIAAGGTLRTRGAAR
jgi:hypothetical protein